MAEKSVARSLKEKRRSARCDVENGLSMCWRRSARTVSSEAGPQVLWFKEVELALDRRP